MNHKQTELLVRELHKQFQTCEDSGPRPEHGYPKILVTTGTLTNTEKRKNISTTQNTNKLEEFDLEDELEYIRTENHHQHPQVRQSTST